MSDEQVSIRTHDGECPAYVFTPPEGDQHPAVIFYMDGFGIQPTILEMGQRLAGHGYVVLLPDLYYRVGRYEPLDPEKVFASGDVMGSIGRLFSSTDNRRAGEDTEAFLAYLDSRDDVAGRKVGTTGYCMGGGMALTTAGTYPDRIAAAASFHGGGLDSDTELSQPLLPDKITARVYIGVSANDNSYPPEMGARLEKSLQEAGVAYVSEFYPGALHGWTQTDFPIYNEPAAERHWRAV